MPKLLGHTRCSREALVWPESLRLKKAGGSGQSEGSSGRRSRRKAGERQEKGIKNNSLFKDI
jgi:hypothetical protein